MEASFPHGLGSAFDEAQKSKHVNKGQLASLVLCSCGLHVTSGLEQLKPAKLKKLYHSTIVVMQFWVRQHSVTMNSQYHILSQVPYAIFHYASLRASVTELHLTPTIVKWSAERQTEKGMHLTHLTDVMLGCSKYFSVLLHEKKYSKLRKGLKHLSGLTRLRHSAMLWFYCKSAYD